VCVYAYAHAYAYAYVCVCDDDVCVCACVRAIFFACSCLSTTCIMGICAWIRGSTNVSKYQHKRVQEELYPC